MRYRFTAPPVVLVNRTSRSTRVYASIRPQAPVAPHGSVRGGDLALNGYSEPAPTVSVPGFRGCYTSQPDGFF